MSGAGLTVGGFYAHFSSKEHLAEEAVRAGMTERRGLFLDRCGTEARRERLESALTGYLTADHRDDRRTCCPMPSAGVQAAHNGTAAVFTQELKRMAEAFETGSDPANDPAPREAALGSLALMVGGMLLARAVEGTALSDDILNDTAAFGAAALRGLDKQEREGG